MSTKVSQEFNISQEHNTYTNEGNETPNDNQNNTNSQTSIEGNSNYKVEEPPMVNKASYLILSISSGLSQFSSLSIMYFFKDELNTNPSQLSVINSIVLFPLIIKPLFGLLSDLYPLFGYRRKVYIILCGIIDSLSWIAMTLISHTIFSASFCLFISTSCVSFTSALGEAIAVQLNNGQHPKEENKNSTNIIKVFIFRSIGMLISSILRAIVVQYFTYTTVFLIASILPLLTIVSGAIYKEDNISNHSSYRYLINISSHTQKKDGQEVISFKNFLLKIKTKEILYPLLFVVLFTATPGYMDSSFYYLTEYKGFTPASIGLMTIFLTIVVIINLIIYDVCLTRISITNIIPWSLVLSFFFSSLFNIWILFDWKNQLIVFIAISFHMALKMLSLMPIMNLACLVCPKGYEGSVYSLFTSSANIGRTISGLLGSVMMVIFGIRKDNYNNLNIMVFIINIITLLPILVLLLIPSQYLEPPEGKEKTGNEVKIEMDTYTTNETNSN